MIAGKKQQKTTNAAAIHWNMIFRTDQNGISKSTIEILFADNTANRSETDLDFDMQLLLAGRSTGTCL